MSDDPYKALGLTKSATEAEIKKAYRKIARTSHPDLNPDDPDAEARFKAASHAYDLLKDPETRARFDRGEIDASGAERHQQQHPPPATAAILPRIRRRSRQPIPLCPRWPEFDDASDIFAEFLRQQGGGRRQSSANQSFDIRGQNRRYALEVAFLDAVNGGDTHITLPDGSALKVKIPKGSADGQTIRLRGKGDPGFGKGPPGDALITLSVRPPPAVSPRRQRYPDHPANHL